MKFYDRDAELKVLMFCTITGSRKKENNKWFFIGLLGCLTLLVSCTPQETFTETYYISNSTSSEIRLIMNNSVVWDTCSSANTQRVWFNSNTLTMNPHQTIRLHPIVREKRDETASYDLNIVPIIENSAMLIRGTDTIRWEIQGYRMFKSDTEWSIYNTEDWQTVEVEPHSYTYNHTFVITHDKIERTKP